MQKLLSAVAISLSAALLPAVPASAFCGFYVAKADAQLFNKASKVVVARKGERTAVTMASDYQGDPKEFALVVPVPTVIKRDAIKVTENALVDQLDAYSAPRLVEYFDPDPCRPVAYPTAVLSATPKSAPVDTAVRRSASALGVKIEAQYTVGEYDILILSAEQSDGLETWLVQEGYKIPSGAGSVLGSYIKQGMKFFVAKVNLKEQQKLGFKFLRPIQVAYDTNRFMLPIRLGTVNADGPQDMIMLMLTEKGRVETTNYRTIKVPSNVEIPTYIKGEFGAFYRALFETQVRKDGMKAVYLEYAWNMSWCDPCAADPIPDDKLAELGAFWVMQTADKKQATQPAPRLAIQRPQNAFITRLHVRYDGKNFPEDLMFQETADSSNFQGRYVMRHAFNGTASCPAAEEYRRSLEIRHAQEAATLSTLTGWKIEDIREKMKKGE